MQPTVDKSSFDYSVFTFAVDDTGAINIPIGVALWSPQRRWFGVRLVEQNEKLERFRRSENFTFVELVRQKLSHWVETSELPYAQSDVAPWQTEWWTHVRNLLVHHVRLSEPRPVDVCDPEQELEPLYEAVVSPYRTARERRSRVDGEIRRCLNGLADKFTPKREFEGYGGRKVRVLRAFEGPARTAVIEGVNLATSQAEQHSDAVVSRLLRLKEGRERIDLIVGYLTSPEGLNGEKVLVDWISHKTGAKTFDLQRQRGEFRDEAEALVLKALNLPT
jgi:hypothetical protein